MLCLSGCSITPLRPIRASCTSDGCCPIVCGSIISSLSLSALLAPLTTAELTPLEPPLVIIIFPLRTSAYESISTSCWWVRDKFLVPIIEIFLVPMFCINFNSSTKVSTLSNVSWPLSPDFSELKILELLKLWILNWKTQKSQTIITLLQV